MGKKFIPINYGWVSDKTPPRNHYNVVILVYNKYDELYYETIGYYESKKWVLPKEYIECMVCGWSPIPYSPNNM